MISGHHRLKITFDPFLTPLDLTLAQAATPLGQGVVEGHERCLRGFLNINSKAKAQGPCVPWLWDSKSTMTGKCFFKKGIILVVDALQAQNTGTQNRQRIELSLWLLAWCQGGTGQDSITELQYIQNQKGDNKCVVITGGGGGGGWTQYHCDPPLNHPSATPGVSGGGGGRVEGPGPPRVVILKHAEMDARATRGVCNDYGAQCTLSCVIAPFLLRSLSYIKPTRISAHSHSLSFACLHFIFALPFAHFSLTTALCTCLCCATSAGVGAVYRGATSSVHVVDPGNRSGKIGCPLHSVFENAGLHNYYNNYLRGYHP